MIKQFLDLLIYEGEGTTNRKFKEAVVYIKTALNPDLTKNTRGIYYGENNFIPASKTSLNDNRAKFIQHLVENNKKRINTKQINKSINNGMKITGIFLPKVDI